MSTAFRVGVFAIAAVVGIFVVWYVLNNYALRRNGYQIAIHFRNVVGLQPGSSVQLAGVDIGVVDDIKLQPDQTASVYCSIQSGYTIYRGSVFTVTQTLTGAQSTLTILPPGPGELAAAAPLPKHPLPEAEQPEGTVPLTIADLVSEGQKRLEDLDKTLSIINRELPGIVKNFNDVALHTNGLIVHADRNFTLLGQQLNLTVGGVNAVVGQLNGLLAVNGRNISAMTTGMQRLMQTSGPKVVSLIDNLQATSVNLNKTMASVQSIAADPSLKANFAATTANLRDSSEKLKAIANEIQGITGDPRVQSQLRSTVENLDATIAKANQILGTFVTGEVPPQPLPAASSPPGASPPPRQAVPNVRPGRGLGALDLLAAQVRLNWGKQPSGPSSDVNLTLLPRLPTHLSFGVNDLGEPVPTYNVLLDHRSAPNLTYSFGVLRSQLGLRTVWSPTKPLAVRAELYNSKQPRLDLYGDLRLAERLQFFYGEKSLLGPSSTRTPQFGVTFGY